MLEIFDRLAPFFEDNYRRINVREYARIMGISPPTASKLLEQFHKEGLLDKEADRNYIFYHANKESKEFIDLSRTYWWKKLAKSGLIEHLEKELVTPTIILFGSLAKAEVNSKSDIDIAVISPTEKELTLKWFEKKLGRTIQIFQFRTRNDAQSRELLNNILNGYMVSGSW